MLPAGPNPAGLSPAASGDSGAADVGLDESTYYELSAQRAPGIVDVTSGSNTVSFSQGGRVRTVFGFSARPGYDLASGAGTVGAQYFVPELARPAGHWAGTLNRTVRPQTPQFPGE